MRDACGVPDAELQQVVTPRTERTDLGARSGIVAVGAIVAGLVTASTSTSLFDYTAPPGVAPQTARPLVLRV